MVTTTTLATVTCNFVQNKDGVANNPGYVCAWPPSHSLHGLIAAAIAVIGILAGIGIVAYTALLYDGKIRSPAEMRLARRQAAWTHEENLQRIHLERDKVTFAPWSERQPS